MIRENFEQAIGERAIYQRAPGAKVEVEDVQMSPDLSLFEEAEQQALTLAEAAKQAGRFITDRYTPYRVTITGGTLVDYPVEMVERNGVAAEYNAYELNKRGTTTYQVATDGTVKIVFHPESTNYSQLLYSDTKKPSTPELDRLQQLPKRIQGRLRLERTSEGLFYPVLSYTHLKDYFDTLRIDPKIYAGYDFSRFLKFPKQNPD